MAFWEPSPPRWEVSRSIQSDAGGPDALVLRPIPAIPECTSRPGFPHRPVRRMMIGLMKRIAHAISGIGEKPALLTKGGLLR